MRYLLAIIAVCAVGCATTRVRAQSVIRIAVDHRRLPRSLDASIVDAVGSLRLPGYSVRLVREAEPHAILLTRLVATSCTGQIGFWDEATSEIRVAPQCLRAPAAWRWLIGHEIGHAVGMRHICHHAGELPDRTHAEERCSRLIGRSVMNPYDSYRGESPPTEFTTLDLEELRRVIPHM